MNMQSKINMMLMRKNDTIKEMKKMEWLWLSSGECSPNSQVYKYPSNKMQHVNKDLREAIRSPQRTNNILAPLPLCLPMHYPKIKQSITWRENTLPTNHQAKKKKVFIDLDSRTCSYMKNI